MSCLTKGVATFKTCRAEIRKLKQHSWCSSWSGNDNGNDVQGIRLGQYIGIVFIVKLGVYLSFVEGGWLLCWLTGSGNTASWLLHNGFKLSPGIGKVHHLLAEYRLMLIPA